MSQEIKKGKFIVIEGGDFCGKTTFAEQLHRVLTSVNIDTTLTRSPGGDAEGEKIRALLVNTKLDEATRTCIFAANRAHSSNHLIKPLIKKGQHVISTRWRWSADVYQDVRKVSDFIDKELDVCIPDVYILLECSNEVMRKGFLNRETNDLMDEEYTQDYLSVREKYRIAFEAHRGTKFKLVYNEGMTVPTDDEFVERYKDILNLITQNSGDQKFQLKQRCIPAVDQSKKVGLMVAG